MADATAVFPPHEVATGAPDKGTVGMICLILTEATLFSVFVTAYVFYMGRSATGPTPAQVLTLPIWATICLLSSSITVELAVRSLRRQTLGAFKLWMGVTILLGLEFLRQTGIEWRKLIYEDHLTIATNVFGTTYYSLVGLHGTHVIIGLSMLLLVLILAFSGARLQLHEHKVHLLSWYWHFVDAVWVVVFTVVYVISR